MRLQLQRLVLRLQALHVPASLRVSTVVDDIACHAQGDPLAIRTTLCQAGELLSEELAEVQLPVNS
eukprot:724951-Amphidinium_carterae.1